MLRNYLAAALRNLARNRLYAAVNIIGLAVGFSAAILAMLFVRDELSFDQWIPGYENIYRISTTFNLSNRVTPVEPSPEQTAAWLEADFPEVQAVTRLSHPARVSLRRLPVEGTERLYWVDPDFLDVVRLPLVAGDRTQALQQPNDLVITRTLARKYFGRDDPVGEYIDLVPPSPGEPHAMRVMAVIEDLPTNSHFDIELLGSSRAAFSSLAMWDAKPQPAMDFSVKAHTYLRVAQRSDVVKLQHAMPDFMKRHKRGNRDVELGRISFQLMPITDIHFAPDAEFMMKPRGSRAAVYGILAVGILIMITAVINYVNLTTARMARRNVEVGIRKTVGASRRIVFAQFIGESLVYSLLGTLVAIVLTELALTPLNAFLLRDIDFDYWRDSELAGYITGLVLFTAISGGAYFALAMSRFPPARLLEGSRIGPNAGMTRTMLVTTQFCILITLIVSAGVIYRQTQYSMNAALRVDKDLVVLVDNACDQDAFRNQVAALPGVRSVGCASPNALDMDIALQPISRIGRAAVQTRHAPVDVGFFETFGIVPLAGRTFSSDHEMDRSAEKSGAPVKSVILNETAARRLGFVSPEQAIGQSVTMFMQRKQPSQVIGVVPDFQLSASRVAIEPKIYFIDHNASPLWYAPILHLNIKLPGERLPETLQAIDTAWRATGSPHVIRRRFVDQYVQGLYASQERQSRLLAVLSLVAVSIACLGLFGLAAAAAEQRTQEIGVRKAMGAGTADVMRLLLWQFTKPVLWANLIAWPVAGFLMHRWLQGFAYRIDLEPWLFVASSVVALLIALLTVGAHCYLVARAKPVAALRYE